jgi:hypothetical protein
MIIRNNGVTNLRRKFGQTFSKPHHLPLSRVIRHNHE